MYDHLIANHLLPVQITTAAPTKIQLPISSFSYLTNETAYRFHKLIPQNEHTPVEVVENDEVVELYWDLTIKTDMSVAHNRPDIILGEKVTRKWKIIDIPVPGDFNAVSTED